MTIAERILLCLSRKPGAADYEPASMHYRLEDALNVFAQMFPNFLNEIQDRCILDFGCGAGNQSIMLAKKEQNL